MLYILSVWLHILAASLWIGGMAFLVLVMVPVLRQSTLGQQAAIFVHQTGVRFRAVGWVALGLLFVTGWYNMSQRGLAWHQVLRGGEANLVGRALAIKLILFALVLAVSAYHDFRIGPRATEAWKKDPNGAEALRYRKQAATFGRINALLALGILWLAVLLVRGGCGEAAPVILPR